MSAAVVAPEVETRHVRVVMDGEARPLAHSPNLLRVSMGSRVVIVDTEDPDVLVEYPEPARVWTDGDSVLVQGCVFVRHLGTWTNPRLSLIALDDGDVERLLADRPDAKVLHYLHGEA